MVRRIVSWLVGAVRAALGRVFGPPDVGHGRGCRCDECRAERREETAW